MRFRAILARRGTPWNDDLLSFRLETLLLRTKYHTGRNLFVTHDDSLFLFTEEPGYCMGWFLLNWRIIRWTHFTIRYFEIYKLKWRSWKIFLICWQTVLFCNIWLHACLFPNEAFYTYQALNFILIISHFSSHMKLRLNNLIYFYI